MTDSSENSTDRKLRSLVERPQESLDVEIKSWLDLDSKSHQADLAKAIIAMANHGGGTVIVGLSPRSNGEYEPDSANHGYCDKYDQDRLSGIVKRFADPPVELYVQRISLGDTVVVVIGVPGGHLVPIRCKRDGPDKKHGVQNAYYIRKPGPVSEIPTTEHEWATLIRRCTINDRQALLRQLSELLLAVDRPSAVKTSTQDQLNTWECEFVDRFETLLQSSFAGIENSPYRLGYWYGLYRIAVDDDGVELTTLRSALSTAKGHETGWPIGVILQRKDAAPYVFQKRIEAWLGTTDRVPSVADFWAANTGECFGTLRGYEDDDPQNNNRKMVPGETLDLTIPIWRTAELLMHGMRLAQALERDDAAIQFKLVWTGLLGRKLTAHQFEYFDPDHGPCRTDRIESELEIGSASLVSPGLDEYVRKALAPMYTAFDFYEIPERIVHRELDRFLKRS